MKIPKWIFTDSKTGETYCERCGGREKVPLPMPVDAFIKWGEYFGAKHEFCKEKNETPTLEMSKYNRER